MLNRIYYKSSPEVATGTLFDESLEKWEYLKQLKNNLLDNLNKTTSVSEVEEITSDLKRVVKELNDFDNEKMSSASKVIELIDPYFQQFEDNMVSFFNNFGQDVSISTYLKIYVPEVRNMRDTVSSQGSSYRKIDKYLIEQEARFMISLQKDKNAQQGIFRFITNNDVEFSQKYYNYIHKLLKERYGQYSTVVDFIPNMWLDYEFVDGRIGWELSGLSQDKYVSDIQFKTKEGECVVLNLSSLLQSKQRGKIYNESYIGREIVISVIDELCSRYTNVFETILDRKLTGLFITDSEETMEKRKKGSDLSTSKNTVFIDNKPFHYGVTTGRFLSSIQLAKTALDIVEASDFKLFFRNKV